MILFWLHFYSKFGAAFQQMCEPWVVHLYLFSILLRLLSYFIEILIYFSFYCKKYPIYRVLQKQKSLIFCVSKMDGVLFCADDLWIQIVRNSFLGPFNFLLGLLQVNIHALTYYFPFIHVPPGYHRKFFYIVEFVCEWNTLVLLVYFCLLTHLAAIAS